MLPTCCCRSGRVCVWLWCSAAECLECLWFLQSGLGTHSLGLSLPDCTWPWTVCHLPAFAPSVTMLFMLSL